MFMQMALTFYNFDKTPLIYSVSYFNLGVCELCLEGGLSSPNPPVATVLHNVHVSCDASKVVSSIFR